MNERAFYLLTYDIPDDRRRTKLARLLESLGERVQYSVFEAHLNEKELVKLLAKSAKILDEGEDSLRVYVLCQACKPKLRLLGRAKPSQEPGLKIV